MVNKPLIRPYSWGGVALGGVARIPMNNPSKMTCPKTEVAGGFKDFFYSPRKLGK